MTDTLGSVPSVPVQPDAPLGSPANVVTPPTTQVTPTPASSAGATGASLADKVSVAANAAPKATPSEVVGAASAASDTVDAAVKSTSIQAFKTATQMAQFLTGKSLDYQNYVWGHASEQVKTLLNTGGYTPPSQQQVSKNPSFWDDIGHGLVSGLDSVRHAASWVERPRRNHSSPIPPRRSTRPVRHPCTSRTPPNSRSNKVRCTTPRRASPCGVLIRFSTNSTSRASCTTTTPSPTEPKPSSPKRCSTCKRTRHHGRATATAQDLRDGGRTRGPALQQTLATVAPSERVTATNIIMRSPKFQEAANLLRRLKTHPRPDALWRCQREPDETVVPRL